MTSRLRVLLALVPLLVVSAAPPWDPEEQPEPPANESFEGKLHLGWKVVRPEATHWSLTKNKGKLTITTQKGTIHKAAARKLPPAKNLFLIANPYGRNADFEVSVCVSDFAPIATYQQGGVLLYDDDDNYVKLVWEAKGDGSAHLVFMRTTEGMPTILRAAVPENKGKVWLRLTQRKNKYEYAASGDGKKWTIHGEEEWGEKGLARIGITASNGPTEAAEIDVCFTDFRARPLTRARKE